MKSIRLGAILAFCSADYRERQLAKTSRKLVED